MLRAALELLAVIAFAVGAPLGAEAIRFLLP